MDWYSNHTSLLLKATNLIDKRRKGAPDFALATVIPFSRIRRRGMGGPTHRVLYVTEHGPWVPTLGAIPQLQVIPIGSLEELQLQLISGGPDLVLIEASLRWGDPVDLIAEVHRTVDIPLVLIYGSSDVRRRPSLLKRAFAEGVHDSLRTPLKLDEVQETLEVLLKFQRERLKAP